MIRHVVWDWNGTLLDDVDSCIDALNRLIADRSLRAPVTREHYRARFGFPVRAFYEELGFDFAAEDFNALSRGFIDLYRAGAASHRLVTGAREMLSALGGAGIEQIVVSAMEQRLLGEMLATHDVRSHLRAYRGLDTLAATSKIELGRATMRELGLVADQVVFVGDTVHDHETACGMGVRCVLFSGGHQSRERLAATGAPIIDSLDQLPAWLADGA